MSQEDPDPIASTQMFRAFTDRELEAKPQRRGFGPAQRAALFGRRRRHGLDPRAQAVGRPMGDPGRANPGLQAL